MANMLFTNNAATTLASSISSTATSLTVASGTGSLFPSPTGTQYFYCTLQATTGSTIEIIKVTARSSDTFTIIRGQDGTGGSSFTAGDKVELRIVAATMNDLPKLDETNTFTVGQGFGAANPSPSVWSLYAQATSANPATAVYTGTTTGSLGSFYVNYSYAATPTIQLFSIGTLSSNSGIGAINVNSSSNGVVYATSSDRRLKTDITPLTTSGSFIDALQPKTFNWINNGQADTGFIADELQQVVPRAVIGQPNAVDANGNPVYQMVDSSAPEMIANMIAELKSLRQRVAALEAKVGA
jgi:hypothetical protein